MNHLVDQLLRVVQSTGVEIAVTILAGGCRITGFLTPIQRYWDWEKEVLARASHEGGRFTPPSPDLPPITPEYAEKVVQQWPELERKIYSDSTAAKGFPYLCLRNATIHEAIPSGSLKYPLLLVSTPAVAAFTLGVETE